jgi:RNA polymerase sigma factor (sigma-70 family)
LKRTLGFTDAEMLKGLISGEEKILRAYYISYFSSIRRYVHLNHGNEEDAKDLFQDVLLVVFQKAKNSDFILTCSLSTYLYSVSRLLWLKELEKRKRMSYQPIEKSDLVDAGLDIVEISDYNKRLFLYRQHFEMLSSDCQKVLSLFMEGRSIAEITLQMGYRSDQHTRNRRYRCKLSLINRIRGIHGNDSNKNGNNQKN